MAMLARNQERLKVLEQGRPRAKGHVPDIGDLYVSSATVDTERAEMGSPSVLVHNAVPATFATFLEGNRHFRTRNRFFPDKPEDFLSSPRPSQVKYSTSLIKTARHGPSLWNSARLASKGKLTA